MGKQQTQIPHECPECNGKNLAITNAMPLSDEQDNELLRLSFRCCICNYGWSELYRLERCTEEVAGT